MQIGDISVSHDFFGGFVEPALDQHGPLDGEGGEEKVEPERGPRVTLQESHEETETHHDHHVHVLEP